MSLLWGALWAKWAAIYPYLSYRVYSGLTEHSQHRHHQLKNKVLCVVLFACVWFLLSVCSMWKPDRTCKSDGTSENTDWLPAEHNYHRTNMRTAWLRSLVLNHRKWTTFRTVTSMVKFCLYGVLYPSNIQSPSSVWIAQLSELSHLW